MVVRMTNILRLSLILTLTLFCLNALAGTMVHRYEPLRDANLVKADEWVINYGNDFSVSYVLYAENGVRYDSALIKNALLKGAEHTFLYARDHNVATNDCRPKREVEIFVVKEVTLNDENRFPDWKDRAIVGLYDPVFSRDGYAAITLAQQTTSKSRATAVHEAAHYWYDRLCFERAAVGDTETFAEIIEKDYRKSLK